MDEVMLSGSLRSSIRRIIELPGVKNSLKISIGYVEKELELAHHYQVMILERGQLSEQASLWTSELRELTYHFDNFIDDVLVCVDVPEASTNSHKLKKLIQKTVNLFRNLKAQREFSYSIRDIMDQINDLRTQRDNSNDHWQQKEGAIVANQAIATATSTIDQMDPRLLVLYKDQKELVGIEGATDKLINMLDMEDARVELIKMQTDGIVDESSQQLKLKSVSISGFEGLGKTTLAKVVYDRLLDQFDCGAFVSVGPKPDIKKVIKDIIRQLDKKKYMSLDAATFSQNKNEAAWSTAEMRHIIRELLENKRYIIVIDDIWDGMAYDDIISVLYDNDCGSRVIITTRISHVAELAGDVYWLQPLSCDNSEKLFYTKLFGAMGKCPCGQPGRVCKEVLQDCEGVPSTIVTMASLLASKPKEDWPRVYNSSRSGYGDNEDLKNMRNIRLLSYNDLPNNLKTCLLYLSMFPKGHLIRKDMLICKWIAEGFLDNRGQYRSLFELGEVYFHGLIGRGMIEPVDSMDEGGLIGCRVYGSVLDILSSLSKEKNFVRVLDRSEQRISSLSSAHRVAVKNRVPEQHSSLANVRATHLRTFNATMCRISTMPVLSSFPLLRVLAIEDCTFVEGRSYHLEHLGKLLHLRYLGLLNTPIRKLPKEIGNLRLLQTMDLRGTDIEELPHTVVLLKKLMCLRAEGGSSMRIPDEIGNLVSLEELRLSKISKPSKFVEDLRYLRGLRVLEISIEGFDQSSMRDLVRSLSYLGNIEVLKLMGEFSEMERLDELRFLERIHLRHLHIEMEMECDGLWNFLNHAARLPISSLWLNTLEAERVLKIIGWSPYLRALTLFMRRDVLIDVSGGGAFPSLERLKTSAALRFQQAAMPWLEFFEFVVKVRAFKEASFDFDFSSLGRLPKLKKVAVQIDCSGASAADVEAAEAAVRQAVLAHPNRPILDLIQNQKEGQDSSPTAL